MKITPTSSTLGKNPIYIQTDSFQGWKFQMVNPTEQGQKLVLSDALAVQSQGL